MASHNHPLETLREFDYNDCESAVVRWCPTCGAVVIDTDYDGRTKPGDVMPMRFPKLATDAFRRECAEQLVPTCPLATAMTGGKFRCTRAAGHTGPCAAVES
jgi:hypothetical protein